MTYKWRVYEPQKKGKARDEEQSTMVEQMLTQNKNTRIKQQLQVVVHIGKTLPQEDQRVGNVKEREMSGDKQMRKGYEKKAQLRGRKPTTQEKWEYRQCNDY